MSTPTRTARVSRLRALVLPLALAMVFLLVLANSVQANSPVATETHRVLAGDTLWDIAAEHTSSGDDVRKTVRLIKDLNDLSGGIIHPGQQLFVPVGG